MLTRILLVCITFVCLHAKSYCNSLDSIPPSHTIPFHQITDISFRENQVDRLEHQKDSLLLEEEKTKKRKKRKPTSKQRENPFLAAAKESPAEGQYMFSDSTQFLPECCETTRYDYTDLIENPPTGSICAITDKDLSGIFYLVDPTLGLDGGTLIKDNLGQYWKRAHPTKYFKLSWWPIGTIIGNNPADTITSYSHAMNVILETHGAGSTIDLRAPGGPRTYLLDRQVILQPFTSFIGQGDTLKRRDPNMVIVTAAVSATDQFVSVSNTEGFLQGQAITVTRGRTHDDIVLPGKKLTDVTDTQLKVQGAFGKDLLAGDTVVIAFDMFSNGAGLTLGDIRFEGITFDGNWRENIYTNSWGANTTVSILQNAGSRLYIDKCHAFDVPSENFIGATCRISNSHFNNLAGSIYHVSVVPDTAWNVLIENCWADALCMATGVVTGHSEAAIVTSAVPGNVTIINCDFSHGKEAVFGDLGGSVEFLSIQNCKFTNFKSFVFGGIGGRNRGGEIVGNYAENCGSFYWINSENGDGKYAIDWTIRDNEFINTKLELQGIQSMKINDNVFRYDESIGGFQNSITATTNNSFVHFKSVRNLYFANNSLTGSSTFNDTIQHGLSFDTQGDLEGSDLFIWERDVYIMNNTFQDFHKSISTVNTLIPVIETPQSVREYYNWNIKGNEIKMLIGTVPNSWGIYAAPGVKVQQNHIISANDLSSGASYPILALGIPSYPGNEKEAQIMGALVINNLIEGKRNINNPPYSIYIGLIDQLPLGVYLANVVCVNNQTTQQITPINTMVHKCQITRNVLILPKRDLDNRQTPP